MRQSLRGIGAYLALLLLGAAFFMGYRLILAGGKPAFRPSPSSTVFMPPSEALAAQLSYAEGDVLQLTRESDGFQAATPGGAIRQGESIATTVGEATITIRNREMITLGQSTEVTMVNLMENAVVVLLKSGSGTFTSPSDSPLSIRARHTLIVLTGKAVVTIGPETVVVAMRAGKSRIGWIDEENITHVTDASSEETVRLPL